MQNTEPASPARLSLTKTFHTYFLVADDECTTVPGALGRYRSILLAEAAPTDPEAYAAREDWIHEGVEESQSPLRFLTYRAHSVEHAIRLARRAYEAERAAEDGEETPTTTTLDPQGIPHRLFGPCGATFRRVPVIKQRTGERMGLTSQFGHRACGLPARVARFVKVAQSDRYAPVYHCPEHQAR
ncbi:hypothetical protein [Streptomyces sp. NPDC001568]|uniref:hypothetical protein n=1 Tax=Streptomyces sp. NPDC001568 TaxID=3364588 RepID=UPI00367B9D33